MSRSQLPQSDADRIAMATTTVAIAAIVWVILAVVPNPRDVPFATAQAATARHVDEGNHTTSPPPYDYFPAQFKTPDGAAAEPIATF
jgi:hypothetical protein